ncbi:MAG TPA: EAL domain-containing protein [Sphingomonas sp.]|nr:EAL domain-containing protein [Sphingomonas sp.]
MAVLVAMAVVVLALESVQAAPERAVIGSVSLLALLGNFMMLDARRHALGRARRIAGRARAILAAVAEADADSSDPIADIDRRLEAIDAAIAPVRHRLTRRHHRTGLPTREPLLTAMRKDLSAGAGGTLAIFEFCDFDRLSAFDLDVAEEAMARLAERIARMVGDHAWVAQIDRARIGVWFTRANRDATASEIDAICYALTEAIVIDNQPIAPEMAAGRASAPDDGADAAELLMAAIATLAGIQRRVDPAAGSAAPAMHRAREAFTLEQDLRQAVARGEFELAYQPLVDAAHHRVCGAEALIRWRHPQRGLVQPGEFIPVVEATGLAEEVGLWALNAACRQVRQWRRDGLDGLSVAVNLSAGQLARGDLADIVARTMARHRIGAGMLEIELTETVAAGDVERAQRLFDALRKHGVAIAIDDFGTGYSSLSYLRQLSFDKLKIDREFVDHVDQRPASQAICQSLIALGRGLGIRVLAEGVERREEFDWLHRHGCTLFQGFHFGRPMTAHDLGILAADPAVAQLTSAAAPSALRDSIEKRMQG